MANLGFSQSRGAARGYGQENVFRVSLLLQLRMNSCSFFRHWDFFCTARVHKETVFASCFCNLAISVCFYRSCPRKQVAILAQHHFLDEEPKIEVYMKIVEKICNLCMIGLSTDFLRGKKIVGRLFFHCCLQKNHKLKFAFPLRSGCGSDSKRSHARISHTDKRGQHKSHCQRRIDFCFA